MQLPEDGAILYGFLNMKLRDCYSSLAELCEDLELDEAELVARLAALGYRYDGEKNRIV